MEFVRIADIKRLNFIIDTLRANLPEGAEVLDVGCGNGVISRSLGEQGFRVRGIDISEKTIEKAKSLNRFPNVRFEVVSAEQLVADGQRYHAVICSEVLEHLHEPGKLLSTLHNVLHENGILIVTVPNGNGPRELFVTRPVIALQKNNGLAWRLVKGVKSLFGYKGTTAQSDADDLTHIQFFTKASLEQLAARHHFRIRRFGKTNFIEDVFPFSFFTKKIKALQKLDCALAEKLPYQLTGGFVTVWEKQR
ncbi:MAG TPA: methyltransferase domain-containing protein [Chitinophagaceae bacterium]|jgi:SAM-dependent methyltransferase|nr:methyltransferase domain-containing protein [Chitinophagaceae bacterium]